MFQQFLICSALVMGLILAQGTCPRTSCMDKYSWCSANTQNCGNPDKAEYMERDCPVSCGYCQEICADVDCAQDCATRAASGECTSNPNYMMVRCKKSCGGCPTTTVAPSTPFTVPPGYFTLCGKANYGGKMLNN